MKYLVKIDRKTIKENPDAGSTVFRRPIGSPIVYEKYEYENGILKNYEKTITQPYDTIYTITPVPLYSYSYDYKGTTVLCEGCNAIFTADTLKSEEDYEGYSDRVCPNCGMWNCCQLELEKLNIEEINESKEHV